MGSIKPRLTINFITSNKHKLAEVKTILGDHVNVQNQPLDLIEIQGTTDEVARDKCRRATLAVCLAFPKLFYLQISPKTDSVIKLT